MKKCGIIIQNGLQQVQACSKESAYQCRRQPEMQDLRVWCLGQKDPLGKEMATTSVSLPGKSHRERSLVGYSPWGHKESDTAKGLKPSPPSTTWEKVFEKFYSNMIFTTIDVVICLLNLTILHRGLYFVCLFSHLIFTSILLCKGMEVKNKTGQAPGFEKCYPRALGKCFAFCYQLCYKEETCSAKWHLTLAIWTSLIRASDELCLS